MAVEALGVASGYPRAQCCSGSCASVLEFSSLCSSSTSCLPLFLSSPASFSSSSSFIPVLLPFSLNCSAFSNSEMIPPFLALPKEKTALSPYHPHFQFSYEVYSSQASSSTLADALIIPRSATLLSHKLM